MASDAYIEVEGLQVSRELHALVVEEMLPGTGLQPSDLWKGLNQIVVELGPGNRELLSERCRLQSEIDVWYRARRGQVIDPDEYRSFLRDIGYLLPEGGDFVITTENVDPEIAVLAGPQLVAPVGNPRFAVNATNARWGSLYDALYVTDVISDEDGARTGATYNARRGDKVVGYAAAFLDTAIALNHASHAAVTAYRIESRPDRKHLVVVLGQRVETSLVDSEKWVAYLEDDAGICALLFLNNGLHVEIQMDRQHPVGRRHPAGIKDVVLEAAVSTIQDFEDAASAVDAEEKTLLYRCWLELMKGTLEATTGSGAKQRVRKINSDRVYTSASGGEYTVPGRSVLLVRNVGLHMYTDAVKTSQGEEIPEGFLDAILTSLAAIHDLKKLGRITNSRTGSVYIVKPKMHGPAEVAATVALFSRVEDTLGLARNTLKIGIMDEERRLTVNLKEAIRVASERVIFINTGFLDRTGDEIHTAMEAGAVLPKSEIKSTPWIAAYEDWNVDIGIETGLPGRAQIGKGMWAAPDAMRDMVNTKIAHPQAGANTAWVPSPRAAVLHVLHYHTVDVATRQGELRARARASLDDILTPPVLGERRLNPDTIQHDLDNNVQGIVGYVARWIQQGIGCSKVPDINDVALMEDRATLRISSQHIANWLHHGIVTEGQVKETFARMAAVVDRQNKDDSGYENLLPEVDHSLAFQAALDLVFKGREEANGYTETVLHSRRREEKARRSLS